MSAELANPHLPHLDCSNAVINRAFRIALGDVVSNIMPYQAGLLEKPEPVAMAGLDYDTPWTRDAAINTWNGAGLLFPEVTRSTLLSVLEREGDVIRIGGQYWDAIIWTIGAWAQYLYTGDRSFLELALDATRNSLAHLEATEFSADRGLFRGPACYGDGVAAYPDVYARTSGSSSILDWPAANPGLAAEPGLGIPMHALSTNCLYARAYQLADAMARELGLAPDPSWANKAEALKAAINSSFWNPATGRYRYLVDDFGGCDYQEGLGHAFVLEFGIADEAQAQAVLERQTVMAAGIPCVWPTFSRYAWQRDWTFGRHSGTVWPHIQGFWATAALAHGSPERFTFELQRLAEHANRDSHFAEIYHPIGGESYGGLQEDRTHGMRLWASCKRQTWSATAFIRMILMGLLGMHFAPDGVHFAPYLPDGLGPLRIGRLSYRRMMLDVQIEGQGSRVESCRVDGEIAEPRLSANDEGAHTLEIRVAARG